MSNPYIKQILDQVESEMPDVVVTGEPMGVFRFEIRERPDRVVRLKMALKKDPEKFGRIFRYSARGESDEVEVTDDQDFSDESNRDVFVEVVRRYLGQ
jgi:hypothetical protein